MQLQPPQDHQHPVPQDCCTQQEPVDTQEGAATLERVRFNIKKCALQHWKRKKKKAISGGVNKKKRWYCNTGNV